MKRLTRKSLDELAKVYPVLSAQEQRWYVGGTSPTGSITGSTTGFYDPCTDPNCPSDCNHNSDSIYATYPIGSVTITGSVTGSVTGSFSENYYNDLNYGLLNDDYNSSNGSNITSPPAVGGGGGGSSAVQFNINTAVNYLTSNAKPQSGQECAMYVRMALEKGGLSTVGRPDFACDYDTWLPKIGFVVVDKSGYVPQKGDVVVHEALEDHKYGHIAMYNGQSWISDFVQRDMFGGSAYREAPQSNYTILRFKK